MKIQNVKVIPLCVFILPFVAVNTCLFIVQYYGDLLPVGIGIGKTFPYFDGGTSISRTARNYPTSLIFKPAMLITSYLLVKYWLLNKDIIIFDCRFDLMKKNLGYDKYLESHICGAHYINLELDLSSEATNHSGRHPLQTIKKFTDILNNFGIDNNSQVVVYDDENSSMAARLWWMIKLVGIKKCAVLDGGFKSWIKNKFSVDNLIPKNKVKENIEYAYNSNYLIDTMSLKKMLLDSDSMLSLIHISEPTRPY